MEALDMEQNKQHHKKKERQFINTWCSIPSRNHGQGEQETWALKVEVKTALIFAQLTEGPSCWVELKIAGGAHVRVHRVDQSRGCCVCCCVCCDGMHVCQVRGWCSRRLGWCVEHIVGKPVATHEGDSTARSACMYRVGRAELHDWALRSRHNAASCTGKGVPCVERQVIEGEVCAPAVIASNESCSVEAAACRY